MLQGFGADEGDVAIEHQHRITGSQLLQALLHGMAGAQLAGLLHPCHVKMGQPLPDLLTAMAIDHQNALRREFAGSTDNMFQEGLAGQGMEHLGHGGTHP